LSGPIVIRILRPYANEEEYLANERFSIDSKSMLLIDQPPLAVGASIIFEIQLQNGQRPIRAEAKVAGHVAPTNGMPGGLRVRFKRFGVATKAFIDRAIAAAAAPPAVAQESAPISPASKRPPSRRLASISSSSIDAGWSTRPAPISLAPAADKPEPTHASHPSTRPASMRPASRRPASRRPTSSTSS
jgi:hypothetical protein